MYVCVYEKRMYWKLCAKGSVCVCMGLCNNCKLLAWPHSPPKNKEHLNPLAVMLQHSALLCSHAISNSFCYFYHFSCNNNILTTRSVQCFYLWIYFEAYVCVCVCAWKHIYMHIYVTISVRSLFMFLQFLPINA